MRLIYKILILTPVVFFIPFMIQYFDYQNTIYEFEEKCRENSLKDNSLKDNTLESLCVWPGGPPQKPILEKWFNQI